MRTLTTLLLTVSTLTMAAQYPPPTNLVFFYQYNNQYDEGMDCDGAPMPLFAYCSHFNWHAPDTAGILSTLSSYTIHWNGSVVATVPDTFYTVMQGFIGEGWVTANYVDPDGTSQPSNNVFNEGLPISTGPELNGVAPGIQVWPRAFTDAITVRPEEATPVRMTLHDSQGRLVYDRVLHSETHLDLSHLASGTYTAFFWKDLERVHRVQLVKR